MAQGHKGVIKINSFDKKTLQLIINMERRNHNISTNMRKPKRDYESDLDMITCVIIKPYYYFYCFRFF